MLYLCLKAKNIEQKVSFSQVVSRGCGIDVHKKIVVATIDGEGIKKETWEVS